MGFEILPKGLFGKFTRRFSYWDEQVNHDWLSLDAHYKGLVVTEVLNVIGDLPPTPSNGESYILDSDFSVWTWYETQWFTEPLAPFEIFYDLDNGAFYFYNGTSIVTLVSIGGVTPVYVESPTSASFQIQGEQNTAVTNLSQNITTTGQPVEISLGNDLNSRSFLQVQTENISGGGANIVRNSFIVQIWRGVFPSGTLVCEFLLENFTSRQGPGTGVSDYIQPNSIKCIDPVDPGTHSYHVRVLIEDTNPLEDDTIVLVRNCKLMLKTYV